MTLFNILKVGEMYVLALSVLIKPFFHIFYATEHFHIMLYNNFYLKLSEKLKTLRNKKFKLF